MVARSPPKDACQLFDKMGEHSVLVKETVKKVDRAMARLQELQSTVKGYKVRSGTTLSPRNTKGYMRCKQDYLRIQESTQKACGASNEAEVKKCGQPLNSAKVDNIAPGEWRRWSLPAAIVQQAVGEILEASNFAKDIVNIVSDSIANKLMQDPKTPQSAFNGTNLFQDKRTANVQEGWNVVSMNKRSSRHNAQGFRKLNYRRYTLGNGNIEQRSTKAAAQSTLKTPPGKHQSLISHLQEEGLDSKCFLDGISRLELKNEERRKPTNNKPQKVVYKFRIVTPENKVKTLSSVAASSSLELRRKAEKQKLRAKARDELSQAGARVLSQMNFQTSNCANDCGKNVKALASSLVSCCTSPTRSIGEQKPLVKVDQVTPTRKPWIGHRKPTKAIMFPNPVFVPSPSDCRKNSGKLCQKTRCMVSSIGASMERKSSSYQRGFDMPKLKHSFLGKENVPVPGKMDTRKPSFNSNAPMVIKHSSLPKVPTRTPMKTPLRMVKQSPLVRASAASHSARTTSPSAVQHLSSSKKPVWFRRNNNALCSDSSPLTCNLSLLSKQLINSPVQPLPSLISKLPTRRKRIFSPMPDVHHDLKKNGKPYPVEKESLPDKFLETKGSAFGKVLPLPPAWGITVPIASCKNNSIRPSNPKDVSVDEMPLWNSILGRGRSISCPKQRPLKPVENIDTFSSTGNRTNYVSASEAEFAARKKDQQSEGKENNLDTKEEGHDAILKKPNKFLRRSWSFGHENPGLLSNAKLNNSAGSSLPLLKYVRGFINMQKPASNVDK